ncbi:DNA-binding protein [Streptomyces caniscabiei]|uniref:DNA-binding protein n=1 Tax=Streptomyces caniscabiei TaxID=2746961 RepID=A0A927QE28_9ACTN|nr:DNA-binding protein [Streptomyces caniscabiei]MBD9721965.1 DNA-binding protein [Streptomyces caniscabiei]MDX3509157.1 DNA-binding protein [Streptomyces caniscabiei]MDX3717090.1 DNA-binding protein [Streptomyces caniscabiei]WEO22958.1 DNA-binding protein [Streptomyces caniscabiei]
MLVTLDLAAHVAGRPAATIRRWAAEGRLTRHQDRSRRKNGVLYDMDEIPEAKRDKDTLELIEPGATPPVIDNGLLAA